MYKKLYKFYIKYLFKPKVAFYSFLIFIILYIVFLYKEKAFDKKFLRFGPGDKDWDKDKENPDYDKKPTKYLNMEITKWSQVCLIYVVGFLSSFLTNYYQTVSNDFIHLKIFNPSYKENIELSKLWTKIIVGIEPILYWILRTLNFFINLTLELQYIIPKFLGSVVIMIPYGIFKVNQNKFIK